MDMVTLGRTGITVNKNGFGALPIQRVSREEAARLLRMALDAGITFFDTARFYTDSEEKIGSPSRTVGTRSISPPKRRPPRRRASGLTWRPACGI